MLFISYWKLFSFLIYLKFCLDIFGYVAKQLDKKAKVDFKIYDVINWETNNYKISQELKAIIQWSLVS